MNEYYADILGFSKGGMPPRNKKNFRSTKSGAGMTQAGVKAYRRINPGSKLSTAVTEKNPGKKRAARRKSFCARSAGQMKMFPKAARDPNSRLRQARRRWRCHYAQEKMESNKQKEFFQMLRKEVEIGANGTSKYMIKNGPNKGKFL
jgi:hypothetical protein